MARVKKPLELSDDDEFNISKEDQKYNISKVELTYNIIDKYWKIIETNLKKNSDKLIKFIAIYRNKNINKLETPYPVDYPVFIPACIKILYEVTEINENDFKEDIMCINKLEGYKPDKYLKDKAPNILMNLIIRYYILNNMSKEISIMEHYIGYANYWAAFTKYFKKYKPKATVMMYTINNMSYRNNLKKLGSVDKWLFEMVKTLFDGYDDRIRRGADFELHYIADQIRNRLSSAMKIIYREQEKNEKAGNAIFTSTNVVDDELVENSYGITEVLVAADTFTNKFFSHPINEKALKGALQPKGITEKDLRKTIFMIADNKNNWDDVHKLYLAMFYLFLDSGKYTVRDIGTGRFYVEMEKLYRPGNTLDENKLLIKDTLDKWLREGSATFRTTNRTATILTFRKSVYDYFILKVMEDK